METDPNGSFVDSAGGLQLLGHGHHLRSAAPVLLLGACAAGAAGNLLALLVLARDFRAGRGSEAKAVLASAAAADALLLVLCAPARALAAYKQAWTLGRSACATADWLQHTCLVAKTFLLAVGTWARRGPRWGQSDDRGDGEREGDGDTKGNGGGGGGRLAWALASAWLLSATLSLPEMLFSAMRTPGGQPGAPAGAPAGAPTLCVWRAPECASHMVALFYKIYPAAGYAFPVLWSLARYTASLQRALEGDPPGPPGRRGPRRGPQVTLLLLSLSGAQALLLLPEWGVFTWVRLGYRRPPAGVFLLAQALVYGGGALSPALMLAMYDDLRRGSRALFRRGKPKTAESHGVGAGAGAGAGTGTGTEDGKGMGDGPGKAMGTSDGATADAAALAAATADADKTFPDVEHFWTGRRNTQTEEAPDPIPWERDEKML
ncbi:G-protein coupled receptor 151-like [Stigmatopora nigra]